MPPIIRLFALVSHGYYHDEALFDSIRVRKAPRQNKLASTVFTFRITPGRLTNSQDCYVDLLRKRECRQWTTLTVKGLALFEIDPCLGMKLQLHSSAKSSARTLCQSRSSTVPSSIPRTRRSISRDHAALTSGVGRGSRLSSITPASVARSDSGISTASRMSSFRSRAIWSQHSTPAREAELGGDGRAEPP